MLLLHQIHPQWDISIAQWFHFICVLYFHSVAPAQETKSFHNLKDEDNDLIHHSFKGRKKTQHRKSLENWEKCEVRSYSRLHTNMIGGCLE